MIDEHLHPANWGVRPILFHIGDIGIPSYGFFVLLALCVGGIVYFSEAKKKKTNEEHTIYIALAAIIGGIIGSKLPIWLINLPLIIRTYPNLSIILSGRTIVGGIIGGMLSVKLVKKKLHIKTRKGNLFAPAAALGISIGRIGCFLRGCCYGIQTSLPWGVDFGDGILRHPTQIYESIFAFGLFIYLQLVKHKVKRSGALFDRFLTLYFIYRFFTEFIRVTDKIYGIKIFQVLSLIVIIYTNRNRITKLFKQYV